MGFKGSNCMLVMILLGLLAIRGMYPSFFVSLLFTFWWLNRTRRLCKMGCNLRQYGSICISTVFFTKYICSFDRTFWLTIFIYGQAYDGIVWICAMTDHCLWINLSGALMIPCVFKILLLSFWLLYHWNLYWLSVYTYIADM